MDSLFRRAWTVNRLCKVCKTAEWRWQKKLASLRKDYKSALVYPLLFPASELLKDDVLLAELIFFPMKLNQMTGRNFNLDVSGWKLSWKKVMILAPQWDSLTIQVCLLLIKKSLKRPPHWRNISITLSYLWSNTVSQMAEDEKRRIDTLSQSYEDWELSMPRLLKCQSLSIYFIEREYDSLVCLFNECLNNLNLTTLSHDIVHVGMGQHYAKYDISPVQSDYCKNCAEYERQLNGLGRKIAHMDSRGNSSIENIEKK